MGFILKGTFAILDYESSSISPNIRILEWIWEREHKNNKG